MLECSSGATPDPPPPQSQVHLISLLEEKAFMRINIPGSSQEIQTVHFGAADSGPPSEGSRSVQSPSVSLLNEGIPDAQRCPCPHFGYIAVSPITHLVLRWLRIRWPWPILSAPPIVIGTARQVRIRNASVRHRLFAKHTHALRCHSPLLGVVS
jgi:hypothetical protein